MNWRLWTWKEYAVVIGLGLVVGGIYYFEFFVPHSKVNSGFGPEWDCVTPRPNVPVCNKRP
jgi:hypothetical protein